MYQIRWTEIFLIFFYTTLSPQFFIFLFKITSKKPVRCDGTIIYCLVDDESGSMTELHVGIAATAKQLKSVAQQHARAVSPAMAWQPVSVA